MEMAMTMTMGGDSSGAPLNDTGVDFTNSTQASTFLGDVLDDTLFQIEANRYARYFWYGVCTLIGICAFSNLVQKMTTKMRYISCVSLVIVTKLTCLGSVLRQLTDRVQHLRRTYS